jgi:hypothetical protein
MYELWNIYISQLIHHAQAYSLYFSTHTSRSGLQFIFHNSYITLRLAVYISQLIHHAEAYSLYFTTHTSRSGLQFVFHNSYITLRLAVYISQLIHHAQAYSLYFTTHTLRSRLQFLRVMYELWNINCKPERNVWVVKYKL